MKQIGGNCGSQLMIQLFAREKKNFVLQRF